MASVWEIFYTGLFPVQNKNSMCTIGITVSTASVLSGKMRVRKMLKSLITIKEHIMAHKPIHPGEILVDEIFDLGNGEDVRNAFDLGEA